MAIDIILDTNVLVTALKSSRGASFQLLSKVGTDSFRIHLSTPLVSEYEEVLKRDTTALTGNDIDDILDFLCSSAVLHKIFYLWRPVLKDPDDDLVLELAVKANAAIITWNRADFKKAAQFGISVMTPREFLATLEVKS